MRAKTAIAAALTLAFAASPASAVTLMVNGDTPSVRYQRIADDLATRMPVPRGAVTLSFDVSMCLGRSACALIGDSPPGIHIQPRQIDGLQNLRLALAEEIGHILIETSFTEQDRLTFARIWRRPDSLPWWAPLREGAPDSDVGMGGGARGQEYGPHSSAGEWAGEAYRLCATGLWRDRFADTLFSSLPQFGFWRYPGGPVDLKKTRAPVVASCALIRAAVGRERG